MHENEFDSSKPWDVCDMTPSERVLYHISRLEVRGLQRALFPLASPSSNQFLDLQLLSLLPDLIHIPKEVDERLDKIRDITYAVVGYERLHKSVKDFHNVMIKTMISAATKRHPVILDVLLHSFGGNVFYRMDCSDTGSHACEFSASQTNSGLTLFDALMDILVPNNEDDAEHLSYTRDLVSKYFPGVWNAVETGNIEELRRLINYWCYIDLRDETGEVSLLELANQSDNEHVIRLFNGSFYTLQLIHFMFSGNVYSMKGLLRDHSSRIQLDFKHMNDRGAPILYYVIQSNDTEMASLLMRYGCKIYTHMMMADLIPITVEDHADREKNGRTTPQQTLPTQEVPVFFSALKRRDLDSKMMKALLRPFGDSDDNINRIDQIQDLLYRMTFKGRNCLQIALDARLNIDSFKVLVSCAGGRLLADRNAQCMTVRDVAETLARKENGANIFEYVAVIDDHVSKCLKDPNSKERMILALYGYDKGHLIFDSEDTGDSFLLLYDDYQSQVRQLARAVDEGNLDAFIRLSEYHPPDRKDEGLFEKHLTWEGRCGASSSFGLDDDQDSAIDLQTHTSPLPLLHRAVIFNRRNIVQAILEKKPEGHSIDTLLDIYRRTALHYAYALPEFHDIRSLLREYGCSDHSLDMVS